MSQAAIEYQRFRRGELCTEEGCRARKFYIEDGKKFCQRGHEQAGFTQTQQDEDDFNTQGKKTKKKKAEEEKIITVLSGNAAKELYLQCLQLVIWKQCYWLVKTKGLPTALESVVRDLWCLRVGVVWKDREKSQSAFSSQVFSSQSEGESSATEATDGKSLSSRRIRILEEKMPKLRETLGLCYLGMLLMRLPVGLGEVWKWASRDEMLFMRAIKEIPKEMRRNLPPYFHSALEIKAPLKGYTLHRTVGDLVMFFNRHFEMEFPQLNTNLLLYKYIQQLSLPVEIYPSVQRLASLLSIIFSFPTAISSSRYQTTSYPEIQLIALTIIATKLLYPFDDIKRVPESDGDPTSTRINWREWTKIMIEPPSQDIKRGDEVHVKELDVWNMNGEQMDQYMDWYQRTYIDDRPPKLAEQILDMFPLEALPPQQEIESDFDKRIKRQKEAQRSLEITKPWPMEDDRERERIHRPGEFYKRYRSVEELPGFAKGLFDLAAKVTGISLKVLVKAVFRLEAKLEKWRLAERKKNLFDQQRETVDEEGEEDESDSD